MRGVVALLAALAVVVALGPRARTGGRAELRGEAAEDRRGTWGEEEGKEKGGGRSFSSSSSSSGSSGSFVLSLVRRWRTRSRPADGFAIVCTSVASRLRSGESPAGAWIAELGGTADERAGRAESAREDDDAGVPAVLARLRGSSPGAGAAIVATRVAHRSGTPLADVLEQVAVGIADAEAAQAERRRALAAPAATARILGWLPLASLVIGAGMGADPLQRLLEGGLPALSMLLGAALMLAGRGWIRSLVAVAGRDGRRSGRASRSRMPWGRVSQGRASQSRVRRLLRGSVVGPRVSGR